MVIIQQVLFLIFFIIQSTACAASATHPLQELQELQDKTANHCLQTIYSKNVKLTLEEAKSVIEPLYNTFMPQPNINHSLPANQWFDALHKNLNVNFEHCLPPALSYKSMFLHLLASVAHIFFLKELPESARVLVIQKPSKHQYAYIKLTSELSQSCMLSFLKAYHLPGPSCQDNFPSVLAHFFFSAAYTLKTTDHIPDCSLYPYISEQDVISAHSRTALQFRNPQKTSYISDRRLLSSLMRFPQAIFPTQVFALALSAYTNHSMLKDSTLKTILEQPLAHAATLISAACQICNQNSDCIDTSDSQRVRDTSFAMINLLSLYKKDANFFNTDIYHKTSRLLSQAPFMFESEIYPFTKCALCLHYIYTLHTKGSLTESDIPALAGEEGQVVKLQDIYEKLVNLAASKCSTTEFTDAMLFEPTGSRQQGYHTVRFYHQTLKPTLFHSTVEFPHTPPKKPQYTLPPHKAAIQHLFFFACGIQHATMKNIPPLIQSFFKNFMPNFNIDKSEDPHTFLRNNIQLCQDFHNQPKGFMAALIHGCLLTMDFKARHPAILNQWIKTVKNFNVHQSRLTIAHLVLGLRYASIMAHYPALAPECRLFVIADSTVSLYEPKAIPNGIGKTQILRQLFNKSSLEILESTKDQKAPPLATGVIHFTQISNQAMGTSTQDMQPNITVVPQVNVKQDPDSQEMETNAQDMQLNTTVVPQVNITQDPDSQRMEPNAQDMQLNTTVVPQVNITQDPDHQNMELLLLAAEKETNATHQSNTDAFSQTMELLLLAAETETNATHQSNTDAFSQTMELLLLAADAVEVDSSHQRRQTRSQTRSAQMGDSQEMESLLLAAETETNATHQSNTEIFSQKMELLLLAADTVEMDSSHQRRQTRSQIRSAQMEGSQEMELLLLAAEKETNATHQSNTEIFSQKMELPLLAADAVEMDSSHQRRQTRSQTCSAQMKAQTTNPLNMPDIQKELKSLQNNPDLTKHALKNRMELPLLAADAVEVDSSHQRRQTRSQTRSAQMKAQTTNPLNMPDMQKELKSLQNNPDLTKHALKNRLV